MSTVEDAVLDVADKVVHEDLTEGDAIRALQRLLPGLYRSHSEVWEWFEPLVDALRAQQKLGADGDWWAVLPEAGSVGGDPFLVAEQMAARDVDEALQAVLRLGLGPVAWTR